MSRATNVPAVPSPTADNLLQVARALKQMVDVREGLTGDPLDANVTFRDLVDVGAVKVNPASNGRTGNIVLPAWVENDGYDPTGDFLSPPKPENVSVTGLFAMVQIQWDEPTYRNHAYAEIWRSDTNVLGNSAASAPNSFSLAAVLIPPTPEAVSGVAFVGTLPDPE